MTLSTLFLRCLNATYQHTDRQGSYAIQREGEQLYLLFEDSNGTEDWKSNLNFPAVPYGSMPQRWYCHRGFLQVWQSILPYLWEAVADPTVQQVTVAGYSHGGALATLAHEYVYFHRPDLQNTLWGFGFGAPRVVCIPLPRAVAKRWEHFTVIQNGKDPVVHLPPTLLGYRHVGTVRQIGGKGGCCRLTDHLPQAYLAALEKEENA